MICSVFILNKSVMIVLVNLSANTLSHIAQKSKSHSQVKYLWLLNLYLWLYFSFAAGLFISTNIVYNKILLTFLYKFVIMVGQYNFLQVAGYRQNYRNFILCHKN